MNINDMMFCELFKYLVTIDGITIAEILILFQSGGDRGRQARQRAPYYS